MTNLQKSLKKGTALCHRIHYCTKHPMLDLQDKVYQLSLPDNNDLFR